MKVNRAITLITVLCVLGTIALAGVVTAASPYTDLLALTYQPSSPYNSVAVYKYTYNEGTGLYGGEQLFINLAGQPYSGDITYGPDKNIYIVFEDVIKRYNGKTGAFMDNFVSSTGSRMNNIVFSSTGTAYVGAYNKVMKREPNGTLTEYVDTGTYSVFRMAWGPDYTPAGGTPDGNPDLYAITGNWASPVKVFEYQGDGGAAFAWPQSYPGYDLYYSIAWGPDKNGDGTPELFAGHLYDNKVYTHDGKTGEFLGAFTSASGSQPSDIAWGPDGNMYVSYAGHNWISVFAGTGGTGGASYYITPSSGRSAALEFMPAEPPPGSISGKVTLSDYNNDPQYVMVKVELRNPGQTTPVGTPRKVQIDSAGNYIMADVPAGTYDIAFKASSWLQQVVTNVTVTSNTEKTGVDVILRNGDLNGDNKVLTNDQSLTLSNMDVEGAP